MLRAAGSWLLEVCRRAAFEAVVVSAAVVYVSLHLSPSSYALALAQLGEDVDPYFGTPRWIRTDEWSVSTPLFQTAVANDFGETNETSFYGETLRSFVGLPLWNWGLMLKPTVWGFFVFPPALAYSIYWASIAALMLVGWSLLLRTFGFSRVAAAVVSLALFFSPLVQAWSWMPLLALFPWVVLAVVRVRSNVLMAAALAVLVPVWLMILFYVPGIPPLAFLGLALCLAFRPEVFALKRLASAAAGIAVGGTLTLLYFRPVLHAYADSVYPGGRWTNGGALGLWQVASQLLPATTTEGFDFLIAENLPEAATVTSWLPVLALCLVDYRSVCARYRTDLAARRDIRRIAVLVAAWLLLTVWQILPFFPLSYALGLGVSPEVRTLFASGALLLIAGAYAIDRLPLAVTPLRLGAFSAVVVAAWLVASYDLQPTWELAFRDELLALGITAIFALATLARGQGARHGWSAALLVGGIAPVVLVWGLYNPLQSTEVIFRKPTTEVTRRLDELAAKRSDGAIAVRCVRGAILNGQGYRSVTHVLTVPSPELFRPFFPDVSEARFQHLFNQYAHTLLTPRARPFVSRDDKVQLPIGTMGQFASIAGADLLHAAASRDSCRAAEDGT